LRSCLIVNACLTPADGHGERNAALAMIEPLANRPTGVTLGADKGYDARVFVNELRAMNVRPLVTQNTCGRRSAIDGRHGEIAYGRTSIDFTWIGFDEGDDVSGEGSAELLDDGSIEIEIFRAFCD